MKWMVKKRNGGYIEYLVLALAALAFAFVSGLSSNFSKPPLTATYVPITPTPAPNNSQNTLQLQNLQYNEITFTPAPTTASQGPIGACTIPPFPLVANTPTSGTPAKCSGTKKAISFQGVPKLLLPWNQDQGTDGYCITPKYIIIHTTTVYYPNDSRGQEYGLYQDYATRPPDPTKKSGVQFGISPTGHILQMADTFTNVVEMAWGVGYYNDYNISIELIYGGGDGKFHSIAQVPPAQYKALVQLVLALMKQYHIPAVAAGHDWTWRAPSNAFANPPSGIYGHYQVNPQSKTDPGKDFFREFQQDILQRAKSCL